MSRKTPFNFEPDPTSSDALDLTPETPGIALTSETAARAAANAVARRIDGLFRAGGEGFRQLALAHATAVAGDTAVTIALAGTLFFSVPSSEARGNVALYLLLTVAPFAVIGPVLGRLLDRNRGSMRLALVASSSVRILLAVVMAANVHGVLLFPAAFLLLILSRAHGIARNALLPASLDKPIALVEANAKLAQVGVLAGAATAPIAALLAQLFGPVVPLLFGCVMFIMATITAVAVPRPVSEGHTAEFDIVHGAGGARPPALHLPTRVRVSQLATAVVRLLNGFLVLLLAFAFKDADAGGLDFGAVLGAAGLGFGIASVVAPIWERRLNEEPMVVAGLAIEAGAAFAAAQWFGLPAAAALAASAGFAWGVAKLAFDGLLQSSLPAARRGAAFTRSETVFQLAWVLGAIVPVAITIRSDIGLVLAGFAALGAQVVYVSQLLLPSEGLTGPKDLGADGPDDLSS